MTKLSWDFDNDLGCEVAMHNGYRIKAVRDDDASNPFEDHDGHWPMVALYDSSLKEYDKAPGVAVNSPFLRFNDHLLVLLQKHIAKVINWTEHRWCKDPDTLRENMEPWFAESAYTSTLDEWGGLYDVLGIPNLRYTSRGYCQGDWAELLIVATPEAVAEHRPDATPEELKADMESQAKLYDAWAWGDVYGYVIEQPCEWDEDGDPTDWEEIADGSCWGYYGDDHDKSGLEEQALSSIPDDEPVRDPDTFQEAA